VSSAEPRQPPPGPAAGDPPPEAAAGDPPPGPAAGDAGHPTSGLDDTVHQRHRLGVLTIAAEAQRADFGYLRDALGLTPGNLSRHLTVLEEAGLVQVEKGYEGRRPRTWVRITKDGRQALAAELSALNELVRRHGSGPGAAG
jgi:DNA-binding transcriptional ArsR family regulator